jgi:hypothetical protein
MDGDLNVTLMGIRPRMRLGFFRACSRSTACTLFLASGLGWAHSGGFIVDHAVAMCERVDVFGMGMLSRGPAQDILYQHHDDSRISTDCRHNCARWGLPWNASASRVLCRPRTDCRERVDLRGPPRQDVGSVGVMLLSEEPNDFFYLSELRLTVMHVLGLANWVWY